uniref:polymorphic toxin-type HINT domain-containing protein n=1 Tax=Streptomyces dangxiongensis TaxID=1442032 RepID=UPI0030B84485
MGRHNHTWVQASKLKPGHLLNTAADEHVRIIAVTVRTGAADMYNLTVSDLHTYYVLAGPLRSWFTIPVRIVECRLAAKMETVSAARISTEVTTVSTRWLSS